MSNPKKNPPVAKIRVGNVTANVWARMTDKRTFYSVTVERSYRDQDDKWKSTDSLDQFDIQNARKALDLAHNEILKLESADRQVQRDREELETGVGA
jgi:hypothetical protein